MTHPEAKAPFTAGVDLDDRGADEVVAFAEAMGFELTDNAHKGHWLEYTMRKQDGTVDSTRPMRDEELLADLLYHAVKLGRAMARGDRASIHEYAADVGNCAMFCADKHDALGTELAHVGPIEYDSEHFDDPTWPTRARDCKREAARLAAEILAAMRSDADAAEARERAAEAEAIKDKLVDGMKDRI